MLIKGEKSCIKTQLMIIVCLKKVWHRFYVQWWICWDKKLPQKLCILFDIRFSIIKKNLIFENLSSTSMERASQTIQVPVDFKNCFNNRKFQSLKSSHPPKNMTFKRAFSNKVLKRKFCNSIDFFPLYSGLNGNQITF